MPIRFCTHFPLPLTTHHPTPPPHRTHSPKLQYYYYCERFEPRNHFKSRLSLIIWLNVVLNRTVVVDSDWHFNNLCGSQGELYHVSWWYYTLVIDLIGQLRRDVITSVSYTCVMYGGKANISLLLTIASSLPAAFLKAFVHFILRGFRFILKFLWHFERQNLKIYSAS